MLNWIELNAANLRHNYKLFCDLVGRERVLSVLKSNAYGHGLKEVFNILRTENPDWIGVNYVDEGVNLRLMGYQGRVLVVGPFVPDDLQMAESHKLEMMVGHIEGVDAWIQSPNKPVLHVEFDTGMSRQGFLVRDAKMVAEKLRPYKTFVQGVSMHFANVEDVTEHDYAKTQLEQFEIAREEFRARGFSFLTHAASSASALILEESRFDLVRVGISTYGFWPSQATKISYKQIYGTVINLKPVLSWRTKVTSINDVARGQFIGYGCTFKARHDMRVAVLPVGYFEGYPRIASGSPAYTLIHGERCPIVGRICMNMMMVDVTDISSTVHVGDVATLIGADGKETIAASDVGAWSQTIHYELVTRLNPDIPRKTM